MEFNLGGENEGKTMNPLSRLNNAAPPILSGLLLACLPLAPIAQAVDPPQERGRPTAILVSPIHEAQVVRGDDGKDHVEYELLVVNAVEQPVTLTSLTVLDPAAKELTRIDGPVLVAATQTLLDKKPVAEIPASAAVSVDVDLIVPPGTAPERVTHRLAYSVPAGTSTAVFVDPPVIDGPEVAINRRPATVIKPPLKGDGWLATTACCTPNLHRDLRIVVDGRRIETAETFAVDWALLKGDRVYEGEGATNEQFYVYGADVLAVADGTVVSVQDGKPDATPNKAMTPKTLSDFGGNQVMLEIAPNVFAVYGHLQPGSLRGEGRRHREGRRAPGQDREHRPVSRSPPALRSLEPPRHLHRTEPAVRHRQLHLGRHRGLQGLAGRHAGGHLEFEAGSFRLPAPRQHPKFPLAQPAEFRRCSLPICAARSADTR